VAVLRSLTATADREARRNDEKKGCERAYGNRRSEASAEQIYKISFSVPIEVDGWRLSNRQNTSGGGFFRTIFFSTENFQPIKKKKNSAKKDTVATTNAGSDRVKIANNTFFVFYCFFSKL
jgi:hypothetical protein